MSSGLGVRGTMGRCYGFWADFKQCQQEVRFVESTNHTKDRAEGCYLEREDYFECLHSKKEFARIRTVLEEKKAQEYEAKHGVRPVVAAAGGGGH